MNYHNSKYLKPLIKMLYFNQDLSHKEIAMKLHTTTSSLTQTIDRYLSIEPPLFKKIVEGKYRHYQLTQDGVQYFEQIIVDEIKAGKMSSYNSMNPLLTETLISFILEHTEGVQNSSVQFLKNTDISTIISTFDFHEFMFLALSFGMMNHGKEISFKDSLNQTFPAKDINLQIAWGNMVYQKYKKMVQTQLLQDIDSKVQSLNQELSNPVKEKINNSQQ